MVGLFAKVKGNKEELYKESGEIKEGGQSHVMNDEIPLHKLGLDTKLVKQKLKQHLYIT